MAYRPVPVLAYQQGVQEVDLLDLVGEERVGEHTGDHQDWVLARLEDLRVLTLGPDHEAQRGQTVLPVLGQVLGRREVQPAVGDHP